MSIKTVTTYTCDMCGNFDQDALKNYMTFYAKKPATLSTGHPLSYSQADICQECLSSHTIMTLTKLFAIMHEAERNLMSETNVIPGP
jgi:hypothetical protein